MKEFIWLAVGTWLGFLIASLRVQIKALHMNHEMIERNKELLKENVELITLVHKSIDVCRNRMNWTQYLAAVGSKYSGKSEVVRDLKVSGT